MSLVANFTGKAARSLGNKFLERAVIPANAATDGEVFENTDMDSATRLAALETKVDGVGAGASSVNRNVASAAERMGLGSAADLKKRDEEDFKARVLRNASEEFRERLAERMKGLQDEITRLNWEIARLREIEGRYMQGGVDALLPEDHSFLQKNVPDVYERITNPENIQKERELRAEADRTGDRSKLEAFQREIARFDEVIEAKQEEVAIREGIMTKIAEAEANSSLFELTEDGQFTCETLNNACVELGYKPEEVIQNQELQAAVYELFYEQIQSLKVDEQAEETKKRQVEAAMQLLEPSAGSQRTMIGPAG